LLLIFFSGDRSSVLGRVLSREVLFFPQSSGILFNHTFGKTLRGDSVTRLQSSVAITRLCAPFVILRVICQFLNF